MDSESLSKAPREVTLAGKAYLVSKLEKREWDVFQAWLRDNTTDPVVAVMGQLARAKAAGIEVDPADRKELFESAKREAKVWPPPVASAPWFDLVNTDEASVKFLTLALRKHQPGVTDDEVARANEGATPEESRVLACRALGFDPSPPKAGGPGATTGTTPDPTTPGPASSPA